jgi:hypothetical protein
MPGAQKHVGVMTASDLFVPSNKDPGARGNMSAHVVVSQPLPTVKSSDAQGAGLFKSQKRAEQEANSLQGTLETPKKSSRMPIAQPVRDML